MWCSNVPIVVTIWFSRALDKTQLIFWNSQSNSIMFLKKKRKKSLIRVFSCGQPSKCYLKIKRSTGPDRVPNVIWKTFAFELAPVIRDLYNTSLAEGLVPTCLKESIAIPTPKVSPAALENHSGGLAPNCSDSSIGQDFGGVYVKLVNERSRALDWSKAVFHPRQIKHTGPGVSPA